MHAVSDLLADLRTSLDHDVIQLEELMNRFEDRSLAFFLFLFALPAAIPLPGLGINLVIALPLVLITVQQMIGKQHLWLPRRIREKAIRRETLEKIIEMAMPWVKRMEFFIRPRLHFLTQAPYKRVVGFFGFFMALSVCIPLPLTNTVPSFGIAVMAAGVIARDGLAILAGAVIGLGWIGMLIFFGIEGAELIIEGIKTYL